MIKTDIIIQKDIDIDGSEIIYNEDKITWKFDDEFLDMCIESLSNSIQDGYFSPAEFVMVKVKKNNNLDNVYCERI